MAGKTQSSKFVKPNDPILIAIAKEIPLDKISSSEIKIDIQTMLNIAYGEQEDHTKPVLVGLAAPQIGISKRIILVDIKADGKGTVGDLRIYINPEITQTSKEVVAWYEGCFSTDRVCGIVERPITVTIKAYTTEGKTVEEQYSGYTARIFQHEIDHLNGKEFVSHIKDDDKLHWVEDDEFPEYRNNQGWRAWKHKCPRKKWEKIKGITIAEL